MPPSFSRRPRVQVPSRAASRKAPSRALSLRAIGLGPWLEPLKKCHPASFEAAIALPKGIEDATERSHRSLQVPQTDGHLLVSGGISHGDTLLLSRDDGLSGRLNARVIRVDRAL